jgi:branched-chain amino acid transport system ATP-binding protein
MSVAGALAVEDVKLDRGGREVLHGVSLTLRPGEIVALLGANGAGKSSLVMTIAGVLRPFAGRISLAGVAIGALPPHERRKRGLAVVAEGHYVLPGLDVNDNLAAAALALSKGEAAARIDEAFLLFPELKERRHVGAHLLSGGQRQMVNIAQALIVQPKLLLIDELSLGLAPVIVGRLGETIRAIAAKGMGVLLIEQFATLALALSSRAYVMERGGIVFSGTSEQLKDDPSILHGAYLSAGAAR